MGNEIDDLFAQIKEPELDIETDLDKLPQEAEELKKLTKKAVQAGIVKAKKKLEFIAQSFLIRIKEVIEGQKYNWVPLKDAYKKQKIKQQLDPRILIRTGEYVESIYIEKTEVKPDEDSPEGLILSFSIRLPDKEHEESGINLQLLARIMEYGSFKRNIPPRPHWRPVIEEFILAEELYSREIETDVLDAVALELGMNI